MAELPELEVLIKFSDSAELPQLVPVRARASDSVEEFKARVLTSAHIVPGPTTNVTLVFNGVELPNDSSLEHCGIRSSSGEEEWADHMIYPNGWSSLSYQKTTLKVSGRGWARPRTASHFVTSSIREAFRSPWVVLALLLLLASFIL